MITQNVEADNQEKRVYDVVVIGAGIAGMTAALSLDAKFNIALVSKGEAAESSTYKAQGGVSAAVGPDDSPEGHINDTLRVGQGLCRREAVEVMAQEGPAAIAYLESVGVKFDREAGKLSVTKEAGHSRKRVVHYYDATGRHISESLTKEILRRENIASLHACFLIDLLMQDGLCRGCVLWQDGHRLILHAHVVIIATGGYSAIFGRSTNSASLTGDGIAAAYRAGAVVADMEFVQFHPTAFTTTSGEVFLLTEALRGEGALLYNTLGERFMVNYHPDGELAPRDEVSRAINAEMRKSSQKNVYLDARKLGKAYLADRFRQVYTKLAENGYFMENDLIPIAPAAHYSIGGILTDLWGKTTIPGLYACGEAAATGVHGANRLASNSLLEGVVFGRRAAEAISGNYTEVSKSTKLSPVTRSDIQYIMDPEELQGFLDATAGVVRSGEEMASLLKKIREGASKEIVDDVNRYQGHNACQLAILLLEAALFRKESRGTHFRVDYPEKNEMFLDKHVTQRVGEEVKLR